jgi:tetratricopeptide (TPR) repeat protein
MVQVLLNYNNENDLRAEAAHELERLLTDGAVLDAATNFTLSVAVPEKVDIAINLEKLPVAQAFVTEITNSQEAIERVRRAWLEVPSSSFDNSAHRNQFELAAITTGTFATLVRTVRDKTSIDAALFTCYAKLRSQKNNREIINSWTHDLKASAPRKQIFRQADATEDRWGGEEFVTNAGNQYYSSRIKFQNVQSQKDGIVAQLQAGNVEGARRFAGQLVREQIGRNEESFAAKSLCSLAQVAKDFGHSELSGAWLKEAVRILPTDGWAQGQLGDFYFEHYQFEQARQSYESAANYGELEYGVIGLARLLRATGHLERALHAFSSAREQFERSPEVYRCWVGYCGVLRDLWRLDEARAEYEIALRKFPNEPTVWCGNASLLVECGFVAEAIGLYREAIKVFPAEETPIIGLADALKQSGEYAEAIGVLEDGLKLFPESPFLVCTRAEVIRASGDLEKAIIAYDEARRRFAFEPTAFNGYAETLREFGRSADAISAYEEAALKFPLEARSKNGLANVLRSAGRFKDALQAFDQVVHDFPFDAFSLVGRAKLLKELGEYQGALEAFDLALSRLPNYEYARYAKASVLALLGDFESAYALLPNEEPKSKASWTGLHVKGMLQLKQRRYAEAQSTFELGAAKVPFVQERRYFETALALVHLQRNQLDDALATARRASGTSRSKNTRPVATIVLAHVLLQMGDLEKASEVLKAVNDNLPQRFVLVRNELIARISKPSKSAYTDKWLRDSEEDLVLMAA